MKKPKQSRGEQKRAEIVAVAKELFFKEGYAGASMAQIAAKVGGSKATLYNHFRSKEELLLAVVESAEAQQPLEPRDAGAAPAAEAVKNMTALRAWLFRFGCESLARLTSYELVSLQRLAAAEAARLPDVGRIFLEGGVAPAFAQFTPVFAAAMDRGLIRKAPPEQAAEHFTEMCTGWLMRRVIWGLEPAPDAARIAANVEPAVNAFLDGYAPR
ncbi:MAG: TetR/AcrR family transcriptional regulator [Parvularculaceae bacterium]